MYVIERGGSFWLCRTSFEVFENQAVSLRLQGDMKDFDKFQQIIETGEIVDAGVIKVYKCADTATNCKDCPRCIGCEIRLKAQETAKAHAEWVKIVESNGGYTF
jgi:hypothetical protein